MQNTTVTHTNGLTFKVIPTDSPFAHTARNTRQLTMADGTVWTVGYPIGWRGVEAAWQSPTAADQAAHRARIHSYGESARRRDRRQLGINITAGA